MCMYSVFDLFCSFMSMRKKMQTKEEDVNLLSNPKVIASDIQKWKTAIMSNF